MAGQPGSFDPWTDMRHWARQALRRSNLEWTINWSSLPKSIFDEVGAVSRISRCANCFAGLSGAPPLQQILLSLVRL